MKFEFTEIGWEDFEYWLENDANVSGKIRELLKSIRSSPFAGIGKPEPLKHDLKGFWSRSLTGEHRLVYEVSSTKGKDQKCVILQCRFHYSKK